MMNKGLEVIEAHFLFGLAEERIEVVIDPQSLIHSLVEFVDGSLVAQLADDMKFPIVYALSYPEPPERLRAAGFWSRSGGWTSSPSSRGGTRPWGWPERR